MNKMSRREFAARASSGILAAGALHALNGKENTVENQERSSNAKINPSTPYCGLYCGACADKISGECHGCGCGCGECAGEWHSNHCAIIQCAKTKDLESCADCTDMPCTKLIQFTHDPVWTTHSVCIDNLLRRRKVGTAKWIEEQKEYWSDETALKNQIKHHDECARKSRMWSSKE